MESQSQLPSNSNLTNSKKAIQDALDANRKLQEVLSRRAEELEAQLTHVDDLFRTADTSEAEDDPQSVILVPGAKKPIGLFTSSEFLDPAFPLYADAQKRSAYMSNTTRHPSELKDFEVLGNAVRQENRRLLAYRQAKASESNIGTTPIIDLDNNVDGLDWTRIAEKAGVSDASSVKRTPTECKIAWIGYRHPRINHADWTASEISELNSIIQEYTKEKLAIDWVKVAERLGTNRTAIDCLRHGPSLHRHKWTLDSDGKLLKAVESCGLDNWQLVALNVSDQVTAAQCQNRWNRTLNPALKRGAWTEREDERLRKAVAGYGKSWVQVAATIPGRNNDQCRERWTNCINQAAMDIPWSEEEDQALLNLVQEHGKIWKTIRNKIVNNRSAQAVSSLF
ncbi:hypothetical protein CPC08DRAFT_632473 [Agrocybe pediades]|nr:hypothetical protein CPC08DRAFT_632473 [Agrocybe pediades]